MQKITLPKNVTVIGEKCFYYCKNLKEVILNNKLEKINNQAFSGCNSLEKIIIPKSVTYVGEKIFEDCTNLKMIKVENTKEYIK